MTEMDYYLNIARSGHHYAKVKLVAATEIDACVQCELFRKRFSEGEWSVTLSSEETTSREIDVPEPPQIFVWHTDNAHEWLEVGWEYLKRVGLNPWDFSRYSYRDGNTFYLEGDCDADKFVTAWETKFGHPAFSTVSDGPRSFIRDLPRVETRKP